MNNSIFSWYCANDVVIVEDNSIPIKWSWIYLKASWSLRFNSLPSFLRASFSFSVLAFAKRLFIFSIFLFTLTVAFFKEFKDTRAVLIMNRRRKDDAALCAGIAEYQKKHDLRLESVAYLDPNAD